MVVGLMNVEYVFSYTCHFWCFCNESLHVTAGSNGVIFGETLNFTRPWNHFLTRTVLVRMQRNSKITHFTN